MMRRTTSLTVLSLTFAAALGLAGCSAGSTSSTESGSATAAASGDQTGGPGGGGRPGVSGVISAVADSGVTVSDSQGSSSTVTYTDDTSISRQESASNAILVTGACVSVRPQGGAGAPGGGQPPSGAPTDLPTDGQGGMPTDLPEGQGGMPTQDLSQPIAASSVTAQSATGCEDAMAGGGVGGVSGTVSSVGDGTFTIDTVAGGTGGGPGADTTQTATPTPVSVTVTVDSDTTYQQQTAATAGDLAAGLCLTATGESSDDTLSARSMVISQSVNGSCDADFGMGRG